MGGQLALVDDPPGAEMLGVLGGVNVRQAERTSNQTMKEFTDWRDKLEAEWKGKDLFFTARELVDQGSNIVTVLE